MSTARMRFSSVELPGKPKRMMTFSIGVMNSILQHAIGITVFVCATSHKMQSTRRKIALQPLTACSPVGIEHFSIAHNDLEDMNKCQTNMPILA